MAGEFDFPLALRKEDFVNNEIKDPGKIRAAERDLLFGIVVLILSIALVIYAHLLNLSAIEIASARYFTAPGFLLLILGIGLIAMAIELIRVSRRKGATLHWLLPKNLSRRFREDRTSQTIIVFVYLFMYMIGLWENIPFTNIRIPFWLNTLIFMYAIMFTFKVSRPRTILIIGLVTSFAIDFAFRSLIGVPLP